jgi:hypothetical protein
MEEDTEGRGRKKVKELKLERKACIEAEKAKRTCIKIERKKEEKKCL